MLRRLLVLLGLSRPKAPEADMTNVIDFHSERLKRMPVQFVGYVSEKQCTTPRRY
jgi:hypothetical protein